MSHEIAKDILIEAPMDPAVGQVLVNMSVDAVVEDLRGNIVQAYQVKSMSHKRYEKR